MTGPANWFDPVVWQILQVVGRHLTISLVAVSCAAAIGLPLGVVCYLSRVLAAIILNAVNVIYTIPSLALFGLMIPLLGIGLVPAIVAVVLYSLLPVVQNTVAGLRNVDPGLREVAQGMGMGRARRLVTVELPVASPVIFAGLRIATVNAIGMVTLASLIGAGGLGDYIFRGISILSWKLVLFGSIPLLAMALVADLGLKSVERHLDRTLVQPA